MACPKCSCKVTYYYSDAWDVELEPSELERCSRCGHIFYPEFEGIDEDDVEFEVDSD